MQKVKGEIYMDNASAFQVNDYDGNVRSVIPFYDEIHHQIIELASVYFKNHPIHLLDTGCGSGTFVKKALTKVSIAEAILCDPSENMLQIAKEKLSSETIPCHFLQIGSQDISFSAKFDMITAIQSHHYFQESQRKQAVKRCFSALKSGGLFVTFENTAPYSTAGTSLLLQRLERYALSHGRKETDVKQHSSRYGTEFFPITIQEQLDLLHECGFVHAEVFWLSYLQAGFYGIKA